jgi:ABC-type oligopeptide transport system substrate-binding subunit
MSHFIQRLLIAVFVLALLPVFGVLLSNFSSAQQGQGKKPVVEEEEDLKTKKKAIKEERDKGGSKKRRAIAVDDEDDSGKKPKSKQVSTDSVSGNIESLIDNPKFKKHPGVNKLHQDLRVRHDVVHCKYTNRGDEDVYVVPMQVHYPRDPELKRELTVTPYGEEWEELKTRTLSPNVVKHIIPYEEHAEELVDKFLKDGKQWETLPQDSDSYLSRPDQLAIAFTVLTDVGNWHRADKLREGENWEKVLEQLQEKVLAIRMQQLDYFLSLNDWPNASEMARDIGRRFGDKRTQEAVAKKLADYLHREGSQSGLSREQKREILRKLKELQELYPTSKDLLAIGTGLQKDAQNLFDRAQQFLANKQNAEALDLLKQAMELWPQLPGLENAYLKAMREYPILRVGVHDLPVYMAPGVARTESELAALDLIFEGLVKAVPELAGLNDSNAGVRYEPALADRLPIQPMEQLVRQFEIPRAAVWTGGEHAGEPVTVQDVRRSLGYVKKPGPRGYSPAWGELLDDVSSVEDERHVKISLKHGFIDPYSMMTFKVLPTDAGNRPYKEDFARQPFGSGPFQIAKQETIERRTRLQFVANGYYGARPGKRELPRIREILFSVYNEAGADPIADLATPDGAIDMLLPEAVRDLGRAKLDALGRAARLIGPLPTRRIYFLAVNHQNPLLQSPQLRLAIAHAISRRDILKNVFGDWPGDQELTGPFPKGSWACSTKVKTLDNPQHAKSLLDPNLKAKLAGANPLKLAYPKDEKDVAQAMEAIQKQLKDTLNLDIELKDVEARVLQDQVEAGSYDLAYYHYDYPSEAYWLWPLLYQEKNILGYINNDATLDSFLRQAMGRRDFAKLQELKHIIDEYVISRHMLFIPLWQLGAYVAIRSTFETPALDPLHVLNDVERWTLKGRR